MSRQPSAAFLAIADSEIVGFALYDCTYRGSFGLIGVHPDFRQRGFGGALLDLCLEDMRTIGYAYAVILDAGPVEFYRNVAGAVPIPI